MNEVKIVLKLDDKNMPFIEITPSVDGRERLEIGEELILPVAGNDEGEETHG